MWNIHLIYQITIEDTDDEMPLIAQLSIDTILILTYQYFTSYWRYLCYKYSSRLVPGVDVNSDPQGIQVDHAQTNSLDRRRKFPSVMDKDVLHSWSGFSICTLW